MVHFRAVVLAALSLLFGGFSVLAQDVTLTSADGAVEINGTLMGFDGEFYRVQTVYGQLTVDGTGVSCDGPGCPNLTDFVANVAISGAAGMAEVLMPALIDAFALRNGYAVSRRTLDKTHFVYALSDQVTRAPIAVFNFRATSTSEGFADLLADEADIAMSLREIRDSEIKRAYDAGLGNMREKNRSRVLALNALVPIVSHDNPIDRVSPAQLAQIFSGQIDNWQDLGGPDAPIALHAPGQGSGMLQSLEDRLMRPAARQFSPDVEFHAQMEVLVNAVQRDPFAIGIATYASAGAATRLPLSGGCGFSVHATRRGIKTEDYPLTAPMFLYLPARRLPKVARDFLAYTRGPAAQIVIRRAGFVDQAPEEVPVALQGERFVNAISQAGSEVALADLQTMVARLSGLKRLSKTFRFEPGMSTLDAQSKSNATQLARAIEQGIYDGRELVFVGFSDGEGSAQANRNIAIRRAEAVKKAVLNSAEALNADRLDIQVEGFGEALPMACDESAWGRQVNRRVEVWLR
ncbi:phosphate ABC transporter substrate-binding/OmpA family protein [Cognatishimia sp. WU-CL00825]|uniref:phosphate ABC transporter substrate-binding/OmpA family protein n=1 Tax=Cognatishimia sp. WU-CL00825 TaxID=3127658 RepID=UPI003107F6C4